MLRITVALSLLIMSYISSAQRIDFDEKSEIQLAIESKSVRRVQTLINNGLDINEKCSTFDTPIDIAVKGNNLEMTKFLISIGAQDNNTMNHAAENNNMTMVKLLTESNFAFGSSLIYAAENNNKTMVQYLVDSGSKINIKQKRKSGLFSRYYVSPIGFAVKNNNLEMTEYFISKGGSIQKAIDECFNQQKNTILKSLIPKYDNLDQLLAEAFLMTNTEMITYILNEGADINYKDDQGNTLLHTSAKEANIKNAKMLVEQYNANIEAKNLHGVTPLMLAASSKNILVTNYLIAKGAEVNEIDGKGETALFYSLGNRSLHNFTTLLNHGADPNIKSSNNTTLLLSAAKQNQVQAMNYLLDNNADIFAENDQKENAFPYVVTNQNRNFNLVDRFLDAGADINSRGTRYYKSLMFLAIDQENLERIKELHARGANIDPRDNEGNRADVHDTEIIMYLIENGAEINALDDRHDSYMCIAVKENDLELAHYLISNEIDVNQNCYFTEPPLVKAIESENITLVKFLIDNEADINAIGYSNRSVMEYASRKGNQEIIDYLKSNGAMSKKDKNELFATSMEIERKIKKALAHDDDESLVSSLKASKGLIIQKKLIKRVAVFAATKGNPVIFELLITELNYKLDNPINIEKQTALIIATKNNETSLVDYLFHRGAVLDIMDSSGKIAEDYIRSETMKALFKEFNQ
ncbi:MAG: ankyrin repeat domain-containing protein [Crocinitomicaceae bacterium]|nr:ankyrin repeat domain-containing protein [Crocinitomicaceae bacterium]